MTQSQRCPTILMLPLQQPTFGDGELIVDEITLQFEQPMKAPANVVYSTNPRFSVDTAGRKYYIKGSDDVRIVQAELIGHILAGLVKIPVPHYAVGRLAGETRCHFCSCIVDDALRDVETHLRTNRLIDASVLPRIVLLDVWLGNYDRNMGNLLGRSKSDATAGSVEIVAIDFEKAVVVRSDAPLIELPMRKRGTLWPTGVLGACCKGRFPLTQEAVALFRAIGRHQIERAVVKTFAATRVDDAERCETVIDALVKRQSTIESLAKDEWN